MPRIVQNERISVASAQSGGTPPLPFGVSPAAARPATATPDAPVTQNLPSQADARDATMTDAATYGTRSRNRAGNNRPNYAEDQEMDFELSAAATKKKALLEAAANAAPSADSAPSFAGFTAVNSVSAGSSTPTAKDATPGLGAPTTKKRKAPMQPTQNSPVPTASATRKAGAPATSSAAARESNIMTFTKHKYLLNKRGELVTDDGTKLCVNGKRLLPPEHMALVEVAAIYPA